jgi:ATP-dependent RNA helicase DDX23/PRP28
MLEVRYTLGLLLHCRVDRQGVDDDRYDHRDRDRDGRYGRNARDRDRTRSGQQQQQQQDDKRGYQGVPTGPRAERGKAPPTGPAAAAASSTSSPMPPPTTSSGTSTPTTTDANYAPQMSEAERAALRSRYLGVDKKKRKIRKMSDRKFVFDWDEQDDTFAADAPSSVGAQRQGAQVMFGRGRIAGMDDGGGSGPVVPKSANGTKGGNGAVHETVLADAMERRKAMKAGYDDRHWTEKPLLEMKERDWRIFREDFSIAARGIFLSPLSVLLF